MFKQTLISQLVDSLFFFKKNVYISAALGCASRGEKPGLVLQMHRRRKTQVVGTRSSKLKSNLGVTMLPLV
jgi:hypothetical protein